MFKFFKRKPAPDEVKPDPVIEPPVAQELSEDSALMAILLAPAVEAPVTSQSPAPSDPLPLPSPAVAKAAPTVPSPPPPARAPAPVPVPAPQPKPQSASLAEPPPQVSAAEIAERQRWRDKLRGGLRRTGTAITTVFTGTRIDEDLYEELEAALLMADSGVKATQFLLNDLRRRVKEAKAGDPSRVKSLLADAIADLLAPLEQSLVVGRHTPTVIMVVGVNGAGKTTSIGKLTRYLADHQQKVLLAAADTFRAAAREQLAVWAERSDAHSAGGALSSGTVAPAAVEFVSQAGGDPASVSYDAVIAGRARGSDVVIADTAGRLPTQLHLMEELKKIKRVITKAQAEAPHEVLLVIDGNTGQNALNQVKAFDEAVQLTGLIVTKLDGTAKGGVLAAIALWARDRAAAKPGVGSLPVYFIGVGEQLEDLQTFKAREFAQALLG